MELLATELALDPRNRDESWVLTALTEASQGGRRLDEMLLDFWSMMVAVMILDDDDDDDDDDAAADAAAAADDDDVDDFG